MSSTRSKIVSRRGSFDRRISSRCKYCTLWWHEVLVTIATAAKHRRSMKGTRMKNGCCRNVKHSPRNVVVLAFDRQTQPEKLHLIFLDVAVGFRHNFDVRRAAKVRKTISIHANISVEWMLNSEHCNQYFFKGHLNNKVWFILTHQYWKRRISTFKRFLLGYAKISKLWMVKAPKLIFSKFKQ